MGRPKTNLTGKKFGKLVVIEYTNKSDSHKTPFWLCKCECGNLKEVRSSALVSGGAKSCGCLRRNIPIGRRTLPVGKASLNHLFYKYKSSAKERNHSFNLTLEQFKELTSSNCYYCNAVPTRTTGKAYYNGKYTYNGIDRVDNSKGYSIDNCVPCCSECNRIKSRIPFSIMEKAVNFVRSKNP